MQRPPSKTDVISIKGTLKRDLQFTDTGGDFRHDYLYFNLAEREETFIVKGCAYDGMNIENIKKLGRGDSLIVGVLTDKQEKVDVVSMTSGKQGNLLTFEGYAACYKSRWRLPFLISSMLLFGVVFKYLWDLRRSRAPEP